MNPVLAVAACWLARKLGVPIAELLAVVRASHPPEPWPEVGGGLIEIPEEYDEDEANSSHRIRGF